MPGAIYKPSDKQDKQDKQNRQDDKSKSKGLLSRLVAPAPAKAVTPKAEPEPERRPKKSDDPRLSMPKAEREDGGRAWQIRLTPSLVTMLSIVVVVTLCFFFLFGVIVGRGYAPVTQIAEPEKLLPEGSRQELAEAPEQILPPEDLRFMSNLRDQTSPMPLPVPPASSAAVTQPTNPAVTQPLPAQSPAATTASAAAKAENFDYILQAAAFKVESQADALREKLEGAGVRTRLVREKADKGTWYKVQVLFRGSANTLEELRQTLTANGIKDALVISKKAIS